MKLTKKRYLQGFTAVTLVLALVRCAFPQVATMGIAAEPGGVRAMSADLRQGSADIEPVIVDEQSANVEAPLPEGVATAGRLSATPPHRIYSVSSYRDAFPDTNAVQLRAARRWGVSPVSSRDEAERLGRELVYIGASPYYHVDPLQRSIPYLVPRAAVLLNDIGRAFFDSLYVKGIPLHRFIVTSVLRTQDDVRRLRNYNGNATENSCHLYGTTFDICYNRYETVGDPEQPAPRSVRNDTLKYVLSEVLRDMRQQGRCYVKYEVKQGCFHATVR